MPASNKIIQFKYGLQTNFDKLATKDVNTIYFTTDEQRLFVGDTEVTRPIQKGTTLPAGFQPPYSLFFKTDSKELYFSNGTEWTACSNLFTHPESGVTAGSYGEAANKTLAFGGTFKVPSFTVDANGHLTVAGEHTLTMPTETKLSKGTNTTKTGTATHGGTLQAVTGFTVDGHKITAEVTTYTLPDDNDTTYTFETGTKDGSISVTPKGGTATDVAVKGLAAAAYKGVVTALDDSANLPTSGAVNTAINTAIASVTQFDVQVVTELPATGKKGVIYLMAHDHGTGDGYDEYIWNTAVKPAAFEKIGNTDVNLSAYMKTEDANAAFIPKVTGETGEVAKFKADGTLESTGFTLGVSVPADAKFTDTVYTHPTYTAHAEGMYKITVDARGHVSDAVEVTKDDIVALGLPGQDTTYTGDRGISLVGGKFGHSNTAITAKTAKTDADKTLDWEKTIKVDSVKYDTYGHITGSDVVTFTMPKNPNTDSKVAQGAAITTDGEYPVILAGGTGTTAFTGGVNKAAAFTYNPSTGVLTVSKIAGVADKAIADEDGNNIKSTYATKAEVTAATLTWGSF